MLDYNSKLVLGNGKGEVLIRILPTLIPKKKCVQTNSCSLHSTSYVHSCTYLVSCDLQVYRTISSSPHLTWALVHCSRACTLLSSSMQCTRCRLVAHSLSRPYVISFVMNTQVPCTYYTEYTTVELIWYRTDQCGHLNTIYHIPSISRFRTLH